jgi:hypothetical protein
MVKKRSVSKPAPTFAGIQAGTPANEFNPDYSTTRVELKRIGILAGAFFVILIALKFLLPVLFPALGF